MDQIYARQRHVYDLTRKFYLLGRDSLIRDLAPPAGGTVLEIGCGTGRNLIAAARRWPDAQYRGLDISANMLETATTSVARAGLGDRIVVRQGDAAAFDPSAMFGDDGFDRIILSYTLSMIPPWREAIGQAIRHLAPGGRIAVVDFGQQERLPRWWRAVLFAWLNRFDVSPRASLFDELERQGAKAGLTLHRQALFGGYAWSGWLERSV